MCVDGSGDALRNWNFGFQVGNPVHALYSGYGMSDQSGQQFLWQSRQDNM
jgi:hypothetical protein